MLCAAALPLASAVQLAGAAALPVCVRLCEQVMPASTSLQVKSELLLCLRCRQGHPFPLHSTCAGSGGSKLRLQHPHREGGQPGEQEWRWAGRLQGRLWVQHARRGTGSPALASSACGQAGCRLQPSSSSSNSSNRTPTPSITTALRPVPACLATLRACSGRESCMATSATPSSASPMTRTCASRPACAPR